MANITTEKLPSLTSSSKRHEPLMGAKSNERIARNHGWRFTILTNQVDELDEEPNSDGNPTDMEGIPIKIPSMELGDKESSQRARMEPRDKGEQSKRKQTKGSDSIFIATSNEAVMANIQPTREAGNLGKKMQSMKADKSKVVAGQAIKDITNTKVHRPNKEKDNTISLPSDIITEARPISMQPLSDVKKQKGLIITGRIRVEGQSMGVPLSIRNGMWIWMP